MDLTDLNKKSKKVDTAMDNVITNAERGALPEAEAKAKMSDASATAQSLHQRLDEGHLDSIDQAEESIEEVERAVCKTQRRSAVQHLKDVFRQARDAMSGGFKASVPNLGIRGVGMSAINFGGGLEEVVDFRNREIGQFRWGAGFFGPSVGGMGLGGYAGIGWKGYKENWTLQEAHITGIFTAASLTPSFLGLNAGLSITFAIDADNSVPGPWVPEPHGFKYVMMGWSAGASITKAAIPLAVDVGVSYSHYLHSECFGSLKELIKYLWLPVCKDCAGKSEPLTVAALRFGIHAPSFPLISEMAFSLMAAMYDLRIREPGYVSDCSVGSVTMRTDPSHFTRQIGDLMFSNARLLEDLIAKWDGVIDQMAAAEKYNQEFEESREYRKWLEDAKGAFDGCPRWGPISTIQQEETRRTYQDLSDADLQGLCRAHVKNYGLDLKCDEKGTRKSREDRLLRYENLAAGSLSLEAVTRLMREVRSTSDAGQVFAQKRTECMSDAGDSDESECMTSVEALKVLEAKVTRKAIYRMCLNRGLQCDHEPKQKAKGPKSSMKAKACKICDTRVRQKFGKFCTQCDQEHDTQDMAMQVVASMGGGMIGNAGRNGRNKDAFGRCQSNSDCWLLNTKCEGDGDEKSCRCEVGSCFTLVQNPGNPHDGTDLLPVCQTEHGGWREMALNMKRSFLTYRYTLGQMVGKFKTMPSKSES
ncbi:Uncharacterized protein SCF082_LOCUS43337 [Durusdinium trenchii]|uniref:Uncharacterized protein n=3 Tax=Durusdinium trenchii TaxID=1381693 RepID=A0ABP0QYN5_9DINO